MNETNSVFTMGLPISRQCIRPHVYAMAWESNIIIPALLWNISVKYLYRRTRDPAAC
jgi:hypothetical protein